MVQTILITGATSGIGKACAEKFASSGNNLIITGRRADRLTELKNSLEKDFNVKVLELVFDVQNKDEVFAAINNLPDEWKAIDILINNAGLALGREYFDVADLDDWETMMQTNVNGLLYVSRAVIPYMIKRGSGHIINLGSVAGKEMYEKGNVYCASKAAVDAISRTMRIDLLQHRIKVTAIHPGAVETEFAIVRFKGDRSKAADTYKGFTPLTGMDIAEIIYYTASLPANVCINDLVVTPLAQADAIYFKKDLP
ncbi:MAG TPA: SDR family NAD(P)-dependent oxidoreductase [Chitinophagaceae bacterium]|nr:SDR family NAD(P)-dependent oxidoreductase [Chitinophagaceae bacterium]